MYKLPAFTNEQIEKLAKEHKLFETVYGCRVGDDLKQMQANLLATNRGWYCVRCGLCCCSDWYSPVITTLDTTKEEFEEIIKTTEYDQTVIAPYLIEINQLENLCPHLRGQLPLNMSCNIHEINVKLHSFCHIRQPNAELNIPCLNGASLIADMDEDFTKAIKHFNRIRYFCPNSLKMKTLPKPQNV